MNGGTHAAGGSLPQIDSKSNGAAFAFSATESRLPDCLMFDVGAASGDSEGKAIEAIAVEGELEDSSAGGRWGLIAAAF